jgi:hypothetical protein
MMALLPPARLAAFLRAAREDGPSVLGETFNDRVKGVETIRYGKGQKWRGTSLR